MQDGSSLMPVGKFPAAGRLLPQFWLHFDHPDIQVTLLMKGDRVQVRNHFGGVPARAMPEIAPNRCRQLHAHSS
jgi:hypothetical protein